MLADAHGFVLVDRSNSAVPLGAKISAFLVRVGS
jgi:hypothetical protein